MLTTQLGVLLCKASLCLLLLLWGSWNELGKSIHLVGDWHAHCGNLLCGWLMVCSAGPVGKMSKGHPFLPKALLFLNQQQIYGLRSSRLSSLSVMSSYASFEAYKPL